MAYNSNKIRVYELVDNATYSRYAPDIAFILFGLKNLDNPEQPFNISEGNGWLSYSNYKWLWRDKMPVNIPKDGETALDFATKRLKQMSDLLTKAASGSEAYRNIALSNLLPFSLIREGSALGIVSPKHKWIDHWLCRFPISLPSGEGNIPVYGASIEMRIAEGGNVAGMWIRWRPFVGSSTQDYYEYMQPEEEEDGHEHEHGEASVSLVYFAGNDGVPNNYVVPYHKVSHEDHNTLLPASNYSLNALILQYTKETSFELLCIVAGGSGDYQYEWAYWKPDTIVDEGIVTITSEERRATQDEGQTITYSKVELPDGVYNIIVKATDNKTGVYVVTQKMVYARSPLLKPAPAV